jgi:hypothetical protein
MLMDCHSRRDDAARLVKKHKTLEGVSRPHARIRASLMTQAIGAFYDDPGMQSRVASASGEKTREKKLGDIWEKFKGELGHPSWSPDSSTLAQTRIPTWSRLRVPWHYAESWESTPKT